MDLYEKLLSGEEKISLVGLGYVGMPIAVAFARKIKVVGFDLNEKKIELYKAGVDPTNEVGGEVIKNTTVEFTGRSFQTEGSKVPYRSRSHTGQPRSYTGSDTGRRSQQDPWTESAEGLCSSI